MSGGVLLVRLKQQWGRLQSQPGMDAPLVRWGLLVSAVILVWALVLTPCLDWRQQQQTLIAAKAVRAAKLKAMQSSADQWRQAQDDFDKQMQTLSKALIQSSGYAAAQAELLRLVKDLLRIYHLTLDSQRLLDASVEAGLGQRLAIRLRLHGKASDVMRFLDAMARMDKLIVLDHLQMNQPGKGRDMLLQFQAASFRLSGTS